MYVDSMCNILVEDPKGGADPHWSKTGRAALTGFIHFIASKCERARANDYFIGRIYEGKLDEEDKRVLEGYYLDMRDPMSRAPFRTCATITLPSTTTCRSAPGSCSRKNGLAMNPVWR